MHLPEGIRFKTSASAQPRDQTVNGAKLYESEIFQEHLLSVFFVCGGGGGFSERGSDFLGYGVCMTIATKSFVTETLPLPLSFWTAHPT